MDKNTKRSRYFFGLGTLGRDGVYTLISMYLMVYLTEVRGLAGMPLVVLGVLMAAFRVFDAFNDPIMGTIVDNTSTRWGKFKPWIVFGVIASGILIKNAIGGVALTVIFGALVAPFISVLSFSLSLKLVSAIIQPFADSRICDLIFSFSKIITLLCVLLIMVFVVYFITVFLIICTQNQIMVA